MNKQIGYNMVKISELKGAALDWAVGTSWGLDIDVATFGPFFGRGYKWTSYRFVKYDPSSNWKLSSIILEAVIIELTKVGDKFKAVTTHQYIGYGDTMQEAICRAYVLHRVGKDCVEIPKELIADD